MVYTRSDSIGREARRAPMLDARTEQDYLRRIQMHDDPVALRALIVSHLRFVLSVAQKYASWGIAIEELVAEGNLGLVEAARRFELGRENRFSTYAAWWVQALIRKHTLDHRRIVSAPSTRNARRLMSRLRQTQSTLAQELGSPPTREQVASQLSVTPDDVDMVEAALSARDVPVGPTADGPTNDLPSDCSTPEQEAAERQARALTAATIRRALTKLDPRERGIVQRRFLSEEADTLADIGATLGISSERVRQIERRACEKLRRELTHLVA